MVRDAGIVDPEWVLSIRTTGTVLAREWRFGCASDDETWSHRSGASWQGRSRLALHPIELGSITVSVDPRTGRPTPPRGDDWACS